MYNIQDTEREVIKMTQLHYIIQIFENAGHKVRLDSLQNGGYILYIDNSRQEPEMLVFNNKGEFEYIY